MSSTTQMPQDGNTQRNNHTVNPSPSENTEAPVIPNRDQERVTETREAGSYQDDDPAWENNNMQMAPYDETQDYVGYEVNDFTVAP